MRGYELVLPSITSRFETLLFIPCNLQEYNYSFPYVVLITQREADIDNHFKETSAFSRLL